MRIPIKNGAAKQVEGELFALADCLALELPGHKGMIRIGPLSAGQWELLAGVAAERFADEDPTKFVAVGLAVMRGSEHIAQGRSHTMALRIARALNNHKPNSRGF